MRTNIERTIFNLREYKKYKRIRADMNYRYYYFFVLLAFRIITFRFLLLDSPIRNTSIRRINVALIRVTKPFLSRHVKYMSAGLEKIAIGGTHQRERSTEHIKKKKTKIKYFHRTKLLPLLCSGIRSEKCYTLKAS